MGIICRCYGIRASGILIWELSLVLILHVQKEGESSDMEKGAVKAVQDLYDVIRHDFLSIDMRYMSSLYVLIIHEKMSLNPYYTALLYFPVKTMKHGICCQKQGQKVVSLRR